MFPHQECFVSATMKEYRRSPLGVMIPCEALLTHHYVEAKRWRRMIQLENSTDRASLFGPAEALQSR